MGSWVGQNRHRIPSCNNVQIFDTATRGASKWNISFVRLPQVTWPFKDCSWRKSSKNWWEQICETRLDRLLHGCERIYTTKCTRTKREFSGDVMFCWRQSCRWQSNSSGLQFYGQQNTVETSTFGSEFVTARIAVELIESLRYKLQMFGVPIDWPTNVYCDNDSVCKSFTKPELTLKKKHNAIAYHCVREAVAANTIRKAWEPTHSNIADMLTKCLVGPALADMCARVLW